VERVAFTHKDEGREGRNTREVQVGSWLRAEKEGKEKTSDAQVIRVSARSEKIGDKKRGKTREQTWRSGKRRDLELNLPPCQRTKEAFSLLGKGRGEERQALAAFLLDREKIRKTRRTKVQRSVVRLKRKTKSQSFFE